MGSDTETTTAANATITNEGAVGSVENGSTVFEAGSTAANALITNNGGNGSGKLGGSVLFGFHNGETPDAGNATLIANAGLNGEGGVIYFGENSLGGTARCELFGNGSLDLSAHLSPGVTTGSVEGDGFIFLGARNLTLGSNNLSTAFSGTIQDGGSAGGTGGSLSKIGKSTLTLSGANSYAGGTTVDAGTLVINNTTGSGTGTGPVLVEGGTLAGKGTIAGSVSVGGSAVAVLAPGNRQQATLTIQGSLTIGGSGTYTCNYRGSRRQVQFDQVIANGVVLNDGAGFNFPGATRGNLEVGIVLTVINNISATPIAGTFSNLPDGVVIAANGGNFQANYEGGDGNDLTLTVVP